jgi:hypothetical protein
MDYAVTIKNWSVILPSSAFIKTMPFVIVSALFTSFFFGWIPYPAAADLSSRGQFGDSFGVLSSLFSGLGFAGLIVTILIQQGQINSRETERVEEVMERRSLFNLRACLRAYEQARVLLADHNNSRATWIQAARLLQHAKTLNTGVTISEHRLDLEISRLEHRSFFAGLVESKPGAFFYGGERGVPIDTAAAASTGRTLDSQDRQRYQLTALPEESIYPVWEAGQWPDDYQDPIGRKFTRDEIDQISLRSVGLKEYLEHRAEWSSLMGTLHRRRSNLQDQN